MKTNITKQAASSAGVSQPKGENGLQSSKGMSSYNKFQELE